MAKIKGICKNIDEECQYCMDRTVQEKEKTDPFVCEGCGKPLFVGEPPPPVNGIKRFLIIAGILIVLGAGGFFAYKFIAGNSDKPEPEKTEQVIEHPITPDSITLDSTSSLKFEIAGDTAQLTATVMPDNVANDTVIWKSSNETVATVSETGLVTAVAAGDAEITAYTGNGFSASRTVNVVIKGQGGSGGQGTGGSSISVSFPVFGGTYTGQAQNKQPHGMGTIRYNAHTLIDSRDPKKRYAEAGWSISGEFNKGRLVQGKLINEKGVHIETIILGDIR